MSDPEHRADQLQPQLTEPLTIRELQSFLGDTRRAARKFAEDVGALRCGSRWQCPILRMPPAYFSARICAHSAESREPLDAEDFEPIVGVMTERDVAIFLRMTPDDVLALVDDGTLQPKSIGGALIFDRVQVRDVLRGQAMVEPKTSQIASGDNECRVCAPSKTSKNT